MYRFKDSNIDAYGDTISVIHFKFGDARKHYNFTKDFQAKYPEFCKEYARYWEGKDSLFKDVFDLVHYIERFEIPVRLYSNYYDQEFKDTKAVLEWLGMEYPGQNYRALQNNLEENK